MRISCTFGFHSWTGCRCARCQKVRDVEHRWRGCRCEICGRTRNSDHNWGDEKCQTCGTWLPTEEIAERWAKSLKNARDYRSLAAYLCAYHSHPTGLGWLHSVALWNAKRSHALWELRQAGVDVVDAVLSEMDKGENKEYDLAALLVDLRDTRAVPLLKRLSDRGQWSGDGGNYNIIEFVNRYPQFHGEVEKLPCAICGQMRPVTETKPCDWKRFCEGVCWSRRGRVIEHGIGCECPYYVEGVCMPEGSDTGLCSLQQGTYQVSCHVYAMHPR